MSDIETFLSFVCVRQSRRQVVDPQLAQVRQLVRREGEHTHTLALLVHCTARICVSPGWMGGCRYFTVLKDKMNGDLLALDTDKCLFEGDLI